MTQTSKIVELLTQAIFAPNGVQLTVSSWAAAISFRQQIYRTRKRIQKLNPQGVSEFDDLIVQVSEKGKTPVTVSIVKLPVEILETKEF